MAVNITMPALSPTMEEGKLAKWHVKEGDSVSSGDVIAEIETDKATMEVEAVDEGKIGRIVVPEGTENVKVNAVIAVIVREGESADAAPAPAPAVKAPAAPADAPATAKAEPPVPAAKAPEAGKMPTAVTGSAAAPIVGSGSGGGGGKSNGVSRVFASPLARRIAKDAGIELSAISGSGPRGRVVKADVEAATSGKVPLKAAPAAAPAAGGALAAGMTKQQVLALYPEGSYEIVPNDGMRKVVAARLTEAKQTFPHFYLTLDCKIDALLEAREQINASAPLMDG
jgi:pyruvate dehydrogenase E2 component (dihydrolipoamide acetyltransferase)